ncbi:MAG: 4Fe-4S ferredoxin [Candidatus Omnitrophica bacterium]|nr:4Fe-4S ferredoxin [Candidatus Omnitrophota bacterium]
MIKITVDSERCSDPLACRLCLDRCPDKVFAVFPNKRRESGEAAGDWTIIPIMTSQCSGCMQCLEFCTKRAIAVVS